MSKKRTIRQIPHLPNENHKELWYELEYSDGSRDFVDKDGKSLNAVAITDEQLEAWKKMPDDEALKEGLKIFRMENMDIPEARLKLEVLKFLCEIRGVMQQKPENMRMPPIMIQVNMPGQSFQKPIIDITAQPR